MVSKDWQHGKTAFKLNIMTLEEYKNLKKETEREILKIIFDFEDATETHVHQISYETMLHRDQSTGEHYEQIGNLTIKTGL